MRCITIYFYDQLYSYIDFYFTIASNDGSNPPYGALGTQ